MSCPSCFASGRKGPSTARASGPTDGMFTADVTTPPVSAAATCSATTTPARSWASSVDAPRCGVTTTPGRPNSGLSVVGSTGNTSMPAPPRCPDCRAATSASGVDHVAAGGVDEAGARLHRRERRLAHEPARLGRGRQVEGDEVAGAVEVVGRVGLLDAQLAVAALGDERVERDHVHPEALRPLGHHLADAAEAEDAERLAGHLDAAELGALPAALHQAGVRLRDVARLGEQQRDGVLGGRQGVGARRVAHHDAAAGGRVHVDVVHAGAGAPHHLQALRPGRSGRR